MNLLGQSDGDSQVVVVVSDGDEFGLRIGISDGLKKVKLDSIVFVHIYLCPVSAHH